MGGSSTGTQRPREMIVALVLGLLFCLLQWPLATNPGYFAGDEMQWGSHARPESTYVPQVLDWTFYDRFQYRPLTFNLWHWLSRHFFDQPVVLHALWVAWGAFNAVLVFLLARSFDQSRRVAAGAALVFLLGPCAMYVHAWIGTLADLIWLSCVLLTVLALLHTRRAWTASLTAFALTTVALFSKESAIVIPALLALGWLFLGRDRRWLWAAFAALLPTAVYLAFRIDPILHHPRASESYAWSLVYLPRHLAEYLAYPLRVGVADVGGALMARPNSVPRWVVVLLLAALAAALLRAGPRWLAGFLALALTALGPVLILATSAAQYGYGFSALAAVALAVLWARSGAPARSVLVVFAMLSIWHGVQVMREMRHIGDVQSRFSPALAVILRSTTGPVRIARAQGGPPAPFNAFTTNIASYEGVPFNGRVQWMADPARADYVVDLGGDIVARR